mmetsp:Transcript_11979/g.24808  ORF Transcript_11979/g.24808 Transcript_11979/m.24808 type:complete len:205 (+) Transcript_11979:290-904(+)
MLNLLVSQGGVQHVPEGEHLVMLEALLLVLRVPALEGRQTEALQRLCQDHREPAAALRVAHGPRHGRVDLLVVVTPGEHEGRDAPSVREVRHAVCKPVGLEHLLPQQRPILPRGVALAIAIGAARQDLDELAVVVVADKVIPHVAPDKLDAVEAGTSEETLELLDHLGVPATEAVQPLVVAVDYHDEVVQLLVARPHAIFHCRS